MVLYYFQRPSAHRAWGKGRRDVGRRRGFGRDAFQRIIECGAEGPGAPRREQRFFFRASPASQRGDPSYAGVVREGLRRLPHREEILEQVCQEWVYSL